jgi:hypothetical protein
LLKLDDCRVDHVEVSVSLWLFECCSRFSSQFKFWFVASQGASMTTSSFGFDMSQCAASSLSHQLQRLPNIWCGWYLAPSFNCAHRMDTPLYWGSQKLLQIDNFQAVVWCATTVCKPFEHIVGGSRSSSFMTSCLWRSQALKGLHHGTMTIATGNCRVTKSSLYGLPLIQCPSRRALNMWRAHTSGSFYISKCHISLLQHLGKPMMNVCCIDCQRSDWVAISYIGEQDIIFFRWPRTL